MSFEKVKPSIKILTELLKEKKDRVVAIEKKEQPTQKELQFINQEKELIKHVEVLITMEKQFKVEMGLIPPVALDLEEAVLGACLLESGTMTDRDGRITGEGTFSRVAHMLTIDHFYDERHQLIWQAMSNLFAGQKPISMTSVNHELRRMGQWKDANYGPAYMVAMLSSKVSSSANVQYDAIILTEYAMRRHMISSISRILTRAYDDTCDVFETLDEAQEMVKVLNSWIDKIGAKA